MIVQQNDLLSQNTAFVWLAGVTAAVLSIPFILMQLSPEALWTLSDFVIVGTLLFGMGSIFILTARVVKNTKNRLILAAIVLGMTMWVWAELAVGIFTNWGS